MKENLKPNVDELISAWSARYEPSAEELEQLTAKVARSLGEDVPTSHHSAVERNRSSNAWAPVAILATAATVLLVVSVGVWFAFQNEKTTKDPQPIASALIVDPIDAISDVERIQKQSLLAELDRLFDGKRVWFAETESDVVLGGEARPKARDIAAESTLAMRLVLAKRTSASASWQQIWAADVVSRTDQVVQFMSAEPEQANAMCTSWAHVLPDGLVACDVNLKWNDGKAGQLSDSLLLSPGDTKQGASINVDGVEYRLFHAVSLLEKVTT